MTTNQNLEAARRTNGQFGNQHRTEAEASLAADVDVAALESKLSWAQQRDSTTFQQHMEARREHVGLLAAKLSVDVLAEQPDAVSFEVEVTGYGDGDGDYFSDLVIHTADGDHVSILLDRDNQALMAAGEELFSMNFATYMGPEMRSNRIHITELQNRVLGGDR